MRIGRTKPAMALFAIAVATVSACATKPPIGTPHAGNASDGKRLYGAYCATCHGVDGDGRGPTAGVFDGPAPRDFTRGLYELRSTVINLEPGAVTLPLRADLVRTIGRGMPNTAMPGFGKLFSPSDLDSVAEYVEGFSSKFADVPEKDRVAIEMPPVPPAPNATELELGRMFYFTFGCWTCHGLHGDGEGHKATGFKDDWGRPISPTNFTLKRKYKGGYSPEDVYRSLVTGLNKDHMAPFATKVLDGPPSKGPDNFYDVGEQAGVPGGMLEPALRKKVNAFIATLPSGQQIAALSDADRAKFAERRLWLLTGYVRSLAHDDIFDMLTLDPSATP